VMKNLVNVHKHPGFPGRTENGRMRINDRAHERRSGSRRPDYEDGIILQQGMVIHSIDPSPIVNCSVLPQPADQPLQRFMISPTDSASVPRNERQHAVLVLQTASF
jgi:hypothetical protein